MALTENTNVAFSERASVNLRGGFFQRLSNFPWVRRLSSWFAYQTDAKDGRGWFLQDLQPSDQPDQGLGCGCQKRLTMAFIHSSDG